MSANLATAHALKPKRFRKNSTLEQAVGLWLIAKHRAMQVRQRLIAANFERGFRKSKARQLIGKRRARAPPLYLLRQAEAALGLLKSNTGIHTPLKQLGTSAVMTQKHCSKLTMTTMAVARLSWRVVLDVNAQHGNPKRFAVLFVKQMHVYPEQICTQKQQQ